MSHTTTLRPLTGPEVEILLGWAKAEGWNPGIADAAAFHAADPQGFIGCFLGDTMVSAIAAVRYGSDFGFIGLYICHPEHRGKGYGKRIWQAGMRHLENRTIGLDGVPEQQANYRVSGFADAYETFRWSGTLAAQIEDASDVANITAAMFQAISAFDRRFFPAPRDAFLKLWLQPARIAKAIIRGGAVKGYAVSRRCTDGYKIGPLFAENADDAERLIKSCAIDGETVHIDIPARQQQFASMLEAKGFAKGFATARMYLGQAPVVEMTGVFGITTLELG